MKKIIVLGGGAAGWLTALYLKKVFNNLEIKLIESEKIGILGAGEGSTPHLVNFLNYINIDIKDLLNKTKGTIKNGINFENWNGDGQRYFHGFSSKNQFNNFSVDNLFNDGCYLQFLNNCISQNLNLNHYTLGGILTEQNKIDLQNQDFSIHFDAHKIANYLKEVAILRGVNHKVGEVVSINNSNLGDVTGIVLQDKSIHECDFIFDCSGFKRLIIGDLYKTPWKDYQKHLPMKKAVPFFLDQEEEITPCTHAIAMKYGWIWKIPLQHRFGSGYIYDSDYINEEQALLEAEEKLNQKLDSPRVISFQAGRFHKFWVNNCIAVGLAAGFTEPLEATSLFLTVQQLLLLSQFKEYLFEASQKKKENYNEIMSNSNDNILDFLYLHYISKRKDSEFWKNFRHKTVMPEGLKEKLDNLTNGDFLNTNFDVKKTYAFFDLEAYLFVGQGLGLIDNKKIKEFLGLKPNVYDYQSDILRYTANLKTHSYFLKSIKDGTL